MTKPNPGLPHMEWNTDKDEFEKSKPNPSPTIKVNVRLIKESYEKLTGNGIKFSFLKDVSVTTITDSGCQTSTCGKFILSKLGLSSECLIPTKHLIVGVTDDKLDIIGVLPVEIELKGNISNRTNVFIFPKQPSSNWQYFTQNSLKCQ